jgi:hypothetical protein
MRFNFIRWAFLDRTDGFDSRGIIDKTNKLEILLFNDFIDLHHNLSNLRRVSQIK